MKRKYIVVTLLVLQSIAILTLIVFATYQGTLAEAARMQAEANAEYTAMNAERANQLEQALKDCK